MPPPGENGNVNMFAPFAQYVSRDGFLCVCVLQWQLHATILTVVRSVVDDGLYDLGTVAGHVPDHVARQRPVLLLLLQQLVQGPGVQLHRIVQIGGIDRHVLMGICETEECKGTKQSDG